MDDNTWKAGFLKKCLGNVSLLMQSEDGGVFDVEFNVCWDRKKDVAALPLDFEVAPDTINEARVFQGKVCLAVFPKDKVMAYKASEFSEDGFTALNDAPPTEFYS